MLNIKNISDMQYMQYGCIYVHIDNTGVSFRCWFFSAYRGQGLGGALPASLARRAGSAGGPARTLPPAPSDSQAPQTSPRFEFRRRRRRRRRRRTAASGLDDGGGEEGREQEGPEVVGHPRRLQPVRRAAAVRRARVRARAPRGCLSVRAPRMRARMGGGRADELGWCGGGPSGSLEGREHDGGVVDEGVNRPPVIEHIGGKATDGGEVRLRRMQVGSLTLGNSSGCSLRSELCSVRYVSKDDDYAAGTVPIVAATWQGGYDVRTMSTRRNSTRAWSPMLNLIDLRASVPFLTSLE